MVFVREGGFGAAMKDDVSSRDIALRIRVGKNVPHDPEIAVVVMSTNSDPRTLYAVESVLKSASKTEIAVVNTGSGSLEVMLSDVLDGIVLIESEKRQFPGGTRNIGIRHTCAPVVSFLAADCIASEGWCEQRLHLHQSSLVTASSLLPAPRNGRVNSVAWASYQVTHPERIPGMRARIALSYGLSYDRSIFNEFGFFDESIRVGEDSLFNERIRHKVGLSIENGVVTLHHYPNGFWEGLEDQYKRGGREFFYYKITRNRSGFLLAMRNVKRFMIASAFVVGNRRTYPYGALLATLPLAAVLLVARVIGNIAPIKKYVGMPKREGKIHE